MSKPISLAPGYEELLGRKPTKAEIPTIVPDDQKLVSLKKMKKIHRATQFVVQEMKIARSSLTTLTGLSESDIDRLRGRLRHTVTKGQLAQFLARLEISQDEFLALGIQKPSTQQQKQLKEKATSHLVSLNLRKR